MSRAKKAAGLIGLAAWLVVPVIGLFHLNRLAADQPLERPIQVTAVVEANTEATLEPVSLWLIRQSQPDLVAPAWDGLVLKSGLKPGLTIRSGDLVAVVGGVSRLAFHSDQPFSLPLSQGDSSEDVRRLHRLLRSLGHDVDENSSSFGRDTRRAVIELAGRLGAADRSGVFAPDWVVFLPTEEYVLDQVNLVVGGPAPAPGTSLATSAPRLTGAVVVDALSDSAISSPASTLDASEPRTVDPDAALLVANQVVALDEDRSRVAQASLPLLDSLVAAESIAAPARVSREPRANELRLPAAAVFTSPTGTSCVLLEGPPRQGLPVTIQASSRGSAVVTGALEPGQRVVVAPEAQDRLC
ncbi:MAG: hypothetical protein LBJ44_03700 [Propionibacteriaceae bacterium]|jgi:hypothetical protein|nr:hypothetical protein [Propionibacteriaceae bacterium]